MRHNLVGRHFGKLTVISRNPQLEDRYYTWNCKCDCGGTIVVNTKRLLRGTITNCGCVPKTNRKNGSIPANHTGEIFGSLTVLKRAENQGNRTAWLCRCECGKEVVVTTHDLQRRKIKNCGCKSDDTPYYRNLEGQRIGMLKVIKKTDERDYKGSVLWKCHCDCGKNVLYSEDMLMHGNVKSCGCYRENEIRAKIHEKLHRIDGTCIERLNLRKARADNKSGHVGIHKINDNRYQARIGFQGKSYYLGTFPTLEDAIEARQRGEQIHLDFLKAYYQICSENPEDSKEHYER